MVELNSLVSLRFWVLVFHIVTMMLFQSTEGGAQGGGLGHTELIPLPSTTQVSQLTGVEPSMPVLLILQGVRFAPTLYADLIATNYFIVGYLSAFQACKPQYLWSKPVGCSCQYAVLSEEPTEGFPRVGSWSSGYSINFDEFLRTGCPRFALIRHLRSLD